MTDAPLVTIGIPCFNSAKWLDAAIRSALGQTWPNCEVLVVDDGSSDGSPDIARGFGNRIQFFHTAHRGANHARNEIVRHAGGEWIQFLDADDYLLPEKVSRQFEETANGEGCDVIYGPVWIEQDSKRESSRIDLDADLYAQWMRGSCRRLAAVSGAKRARSAGGLERDDALLPGARALPPRH